MKQSDYPNCNDLYLMIFCIINLSFLQSVFKMHRAIAKSEVIEHVQVTIAHFQAEKPTLRRKGSYNVSICDYKSADLAEFEK